MIIFPGLWVDDERPLPREYEEQGWRAVMSFHGAIVLLEKNRYNEVSLDHDLACFYGNREMTGYDILVWLVDRKVNGTGHVPERVFVHSANPPGREKMQQVIDRYFG